ncbi:ORF6N domain-containing protein [Candidatus Woesearchaeota archaeon]|nr:ORF6N domain-containing protein [Candidatus Woesearchaeota archaeon]
MNKRLAVFNQEEIKRKIYTIRELQIMFDRDLAGLYSIETRVLKQAVNRNKKRFPPDFMLQLNDKEIGYLLSQNAIPGDNNLRFQIGTSDVKKVSQNVIPQRHFI